jgi:hypothetical protein
MVVLPGVDDPDHLPFCYTIGNAERGLPELLLIGVGRDGSGALNVASEIIIERGKAFDDGELVSLGGKYSVKVVNADPEVKQFYTVQAGEILEHQNYHVQQVIACDRQGRFPDDPACEEPYASYPICSYSFWSKHNG